MKIVVNVSEMQGGWFMGRCLSVPGCVSVGETVGDVQEIMMRQMASYLASMDANRSGRIEPTISVVLHPSRRGIPPANES